MRFKGTKAWPRGFKPTFHPERLDEPKRLRKPSKIFVCSMGELFGKWVPEYWLFAILDIIEECPQHIFQILTKSPEEGFEKWWLFPENVWLGVTVDTQDALYKAIWLSCFEVGKKFLSFEPLLTPIDFSDFPIKMLDWIIIGAQTRPYRPPKIEWVQKIVEIANDNGIPIFLKNNLAPIWKEKLRQEFPPPCPAGC